VCIGKYFAVPHNMKHFSRGTAGVIQPHAGGNGTRGQNSSACNPYPNITNLPKMPIDQNTGKRRQATETERITVIEKHAEGKNYRQIARETTVSKSEAYRIVKR